MHNERIPRRVIKYKYLIESYVVISFLSESVVSLAAGTVNPPEFDGWELATTHVLRPVAMRKKGAGNSWASVYKFTVCGLVLLPEHSSSGNSPNIQSLMSLTIPFLLSFLVSHFSSKNINPFPANNYDLAKPAIIGINEVQS